MSRFALSDTGDWKLKFPDSQDVRGFRVLDAGRNDTGLTVDDMIVDSDAERVSHVTFSDGTLFPAEDLSIGDGVVYATRTPDTGDDVAESVTVFDEQGHVERREDVEDADFDAFDSSFRTHHATAYAGGVYDDAVPAYRYGFDSAHDADNRNRTFADAEETVRAAYATRQAGRDYDADRDAILYGYTTAQRSGQSRR